MTPGLQCKHLASDCSHTLISANSHCCDSQLGINKLIYAFNPDYMPGVDEVDMVPYDTMHIELDGIVRQELAYMLYIFVTKHKYFTLAQLNAAIRSFPWPKGHRVPDVDAKSLEGVCAWVVALTPVATPAPILRSCHSVCCALCERSAPSPRPIAYHLRKLCDAPMGVTCTLKIGMA